MFSYIPLASGSSGNCFIVETPGTKIIIDMGISFAKLSRYADEFNVSLEDVSRLYITHAHSDHTSGLLTFLKKTNIPAYTRQKTKEILLRKYPKDIHLIERMHLINTPFHEENDLKISYFKLPHNGWMAAGQDDAGEHIGFVLEWQGRKLSFMTDCGHLTDGVKEIIRASDAYIIESNYDHDMQLKSSRPWGLINRIMGDYGHLSNDQAAEYLLELSDVTRTKHVFLAHLSHQCNTPERAKETVCRRLVALTDLHVTTDLLKRHIVTAA